MSASSEFGRWSMGEDLIAYGLPDLVMELN